MLRLKNKNLADRNANSRPQSGGGAFGGGSGGSVASVKGEAPVTTNAKNGGLPVKDFTKKI